MSTVLGIHSNIGTPTDEGNVVSTDSQITHDGSTSTATNLSNMGHAWISVTKDGQTTTFGLWPKQHPAIPEEQLSGWNNAGTEIRQGMEDDLPPVASRYFLLSHEQEMILNERLNISERWSHENNCSKWAVDTVHDVTGMDVSRRDSRLGYLVQTPQSLSITLEKLEKDQPTSKCNPLALVDTHALTVSDAKSSIGAEGKESVSAINPSVEYLSKKQFLLALQESAVDDENNIGATEDNRHEHVINTDHESEL